MSIVKKILAGAALIAVIVLAVRFIPRRTDDVPKAPKHITGMELTKVDNKTFEVKTLPIGEWIKLGEQNGLYKNPATGEYTMAPAITCRACGKMVPDPQNQQGAKCPLCGKDPVQMELTKVDNKTFEVKTLPVSEWTKLGEQDGLYKNPATGEYTMAQAITCKACGKMIPDLQNQQGVKCPLCGKNPYQAGQDQ